MEKFFFIWISCGVLLTQLLAVGAFECTDKKQLLEEISSRVRQQSDCVMHCTILTYSRTVELQDSRTIRLKDSTEGDLGEYCWSRALQCTPGESLQHAYVLLPGEVSSEQHLELRASSVALALAHDTTPLSDHCGLRFDVTKQLNTRQMGPDFCVQVITHPEQARNSGLQCPPFLATIWHKHPDLSS